MGTYVHVCCNLYWGQNVPREFRPFVPSLRGAETAKAAHKQTRVWVAISADTASVTANPHSLVGGRGGGGRWWSEWVCHGDLRMQDEQIDKNARSSSLPEISCFFSSFNCSFRSLVVSVLVCTVHLRQTVCAKLRTHSYNRWGSSRSTSAYAPPPLHSSTPPCPEARVSLSLSHTQIERDRLAQSERQGNKDPLLCLW